jgi:hypothetical protein
MDTPSASCFDGYSVLRLPLDQSRMGPAQYKVLRPDGSECCYGVSLESAEQAIQADRSATLPIIPDLGGMIGVVELLAAETSLDLNGARGADL